MPVVAILGAHAAQGEVKGTRRYLSAAQGGMLGARAMAWYANQGKERMRADCSSDPEAAFRPSTRKGGFHQTALRPRGDLEGGKVQRDVEPDAPAPAPEKWVVFSGPISSASSGHTRPAPAGRGPRSGRWRVRGWAQAVLEEAGPGWDCRAASTWQAEGRVLCDEGVGYNRAMVHSREETCHCPRSRHRSTETR